MGPLEKTILEQFKTRLRERLQVYKIILFGSRARGDADPQSDLDVVVVLDDGIDASAREYVSDCAWEAGFRHGIVVVPVVSGYFPHAAPDVVFKLRRDLMCQGS